MLIWSQLQIMTIFDYALYKELKKEELNNNCIKKIIPGVEFSVKIDNSVVHIIALFDDCSPNIKNIQKYVLINIHYMMTIIALAKKGF